MRIANVILEMLPTIDGVKYTTMGHCVYAGTARQCIEFALEVSDENPGIAKGLHITLRKNMEPVSNWSTSFDLCLDGPRQIGYHAKTAKKKKARFDINENKWVNKPNKKKMGDIATALSEYINFMYPFVEEENTDGK